jgi:alpha-tubulin suppressor-like RCC1 family protein
MSVFGTHEFIQLKTQIGENTDGLALLTSNYSAFSTLTSDSIVGINSSLTTAQQDITALDTAITAYNSNNDANIGSINTSIVGIGSSLTTLNSNIALTLTTEEYQRLALAQNLSISNLYLSEEEFANYNLTKGIADLAQSVFNKAVDETLSSLNSAKNILGASLIAGTFTLGGQLINNVDDAFLNIDGRLTTATGDIAGLKEGYVGIGSALLLKADTSNIELSNTRYDSNISTIYTALSNCYTQEETDTLLSYKVSGSNFNTLATTVSTSNTKYDEAITALQNNSGNGITQEQLDAKAPIISPSFTGVVAIPSYTDLTTTLNTFATDIGTTANTILSTIDSMNTNITSINTILTNNAEVFTSLDTINISLNTFNTALTNKLDVFTTSRTKLGFEAGATNQQLSTTAIGTLAGRSSQQEGAVAIGAYSGQNNQGNSAIAIGNDSGGTNQANNSIAIGPSTNSLGENSISIGKGSGLTGTAPNSIIINATGTNLINQNNVGSFIVKPIRATDVSTGLLSYNTVSSEITISTLAQVKISFNASPTFTGVVAIPNYTNLTTTLNTYASDIATKSPSLNPTFEGIVSIPNYTNLTTTLNTYASDIATKSPSLNPTFTGNVALPSTTNYNGINLGTTLTSKSPSLNPTFTGVVTLPSTTTYNNINIGTTLDQKAVSLNSVLTGTTSVQGTLALPSFQNVDAKLTELNAFMNSEKGLSTNGFDSCYPIDNITLRLPYLETVDGANLHANISSVLDVIPQKQVLGIYDFSDFGDRSGNYQNFITSTDATFSFVNTGTIYDNGLKMLTGKAEAVLTNGLDYGASSGDGDIIVSAGTELSTGYSFRIKYTLQTAPTVNTQICGAGVLPLAYPPAAQTVLSAPRGFHLFITTAKTLILYFIDAFGLMTSSVAWAGALVLNQQYDITIVINGSTKLVSNNIPVFCYIDKLLIASTYAYYTIGIVENIGLRVGTFDTNTNNKFVLIGKTTSTHYLNYLAVWQSELSLLTITALYSDDYRDYTITTVQTTNDYVDFRVALKGSNTSLNVYTTLADYNYLSGMVSYNGRYLISGLVKSNSNYKTCVCYYNFGSLLDTSGTSHQGLVNINELLNESVVLSNSSAYFSPWSSLSTNLSSLYLKNFLYDLKTSNGFEINFKLNPTTYLAGSQIIADTGVSILSVSDFSLGETFSVVLNTLGYAYSLGNLRNAGSGQPYSDSNLTKYTLIPYFYKNEIVISKYFCGKNYTFFISTTNVVYFSGALFSVCGNPLILTAQYEPVAIPFFTTNSLIITDIYCGLDMVYFKTDLGRCYVSGSNLKGQHGINTTVGTATTPIIIPVITAYASANWVMYPNNSTQSIFLLLKTTNKLYTWGDNLTTGQLGVNTIVNVLTPTLVSTINALAGDYVVSMAQGLKYAIILTNLGYVYNCGVNDVAQWGNNATNTTVNKLPILNSYWGTASRPLGCILQLYTLGVKTTYFRVNIGYTYDEFFGCGYNTENQITTTGTAQTQPVSIFKYYGTTIGIGYNMLVRYNQLDNSYYTSVNDKGFKQYGYNADLKPMIGNDNDIKKNVITGVPDGFIQVGEDNYRTSYGNVARGFHINMNEGYKLGFMFKSVKNTSILYRCDTGLISGEYSDISVRVGIVNDHTTVSFIINGVLATTTELCQINGFDYVSNSSIGFESNRLLITNTYINFYMKNFNIMTNYNQPTFLTYYQGNSLTQTVAQNAYFSFGTVSVPHSLISLSNNIYTFLGSGTVRCNLPLTVYNIAKNDYIIIQAVSSAFGTSVIYSKLFTAAAASFSFVCSWFNDCNAGDTITFQKVGVGSLRIDKASYIVITYV